ncbi:MAG: baseplate J/gp47 family protein [Clostridia bacterium]|nr:baseplate J/gp47 family protein [Clostridia bacterium]
MDTPILNKVDFQEKIKDLSKFYVPEWVYDEEDPDFGVIFSKVMEDMFDDTARCMNRIPSNYYLYFLNLLGAKKIPAMSSTGMATVTTLSGGSGSYIRKGTSLFCNKTSAGKVNFEVAESMYAIDVKINDIIYADGDKDFIHRLYENEEREENVTKPFKMFFEYGENLQKHDIYISESSLLIAKDFTTLEMKLVDSKSLENEKFLAKFFSNKNNVSWQYYAGDKWNKIEDVALEEDKIILKFSGNAEFSEFNGKSDRYIKCSILKLPSQGVRLTDVKLSTKAEGILSDITLCNSAELAKADFFPFGEELSSYTDFCIASEEAFTKKGANISINVEMQFIDVETTDGAYVKKIHYKNIMNRSDFEDPPQVSASILKVNWEYWNGLGWAKLYQKTENEDFFVFTDKDIIHKKLEFKCPDDFAPKSVGPSENYFIRARITKLKNPFNSFQKYISPYIHNLTIDYSYDDMVELENIQTESNLETQRIDLTEDGRKLVMSNELDMKPIIYFNISNPISKGPFKILFDIDDTLCESFPKIQWEYYAKDEKGREAWQPLQVIDYTEGFKHSGIVTYMGKSDFCQTSLFGKEGYFIRAVNVDEKYRGIRNKRDYPVINGIYPNTVVINQQETMLPEKFFTKDFEKNKVCQLSKKNVINARVWVNEINSLPTNKEREFIYNEDNDSIRIERNRDGKITSLWVEWKEIPSMVLAGKYDRVFEIDRNAGMIHFGDGENGKIPPSQEKESIIVRYSISQGEKGNVPEGHISGFSDSTAYLNRITNLKPLIGGIDEEENYQAADRISLDLLSMNRVVSADDFKYLISAYNRNIYRVKCIPHINSRCEPDYGKISVVVLPKQYMQGYEKFSLLKRGIEEFVRQRAPLTISAKDKMNIFEASYVEIDIDLDVVVYDYDSCNDVDVKITDLLSDFLNPITGNFNHKGWEIGTIPNKEQIHSIVKTIKEIKWLKRADMFARVVTSHGKKDIDFIKLANNPFVVPICGKLDVNVVIDNEYSF